MDCLKEIQQFLATDTPQHLKAIAVTNVLSTLIKFQSLKFFAILFY